MRRKEVATLFNLSPWLSKHTALRGPRSRRVFRLLEPFYRGPEPTKTVFILGCGRSGTSILGRIISHHPSILYLNEPRFIWSDGYPQTDIWSAKARKRRGRLDLDMSICTPTRNRSVRKKFGLALSMYGKRRLVEKLPENVFRIPFLLRIFPDARFIHIIRHGAEVAHSIEKLAHEAKWYGWNNYKWEELQRLALNLPWGEEAVRHCRDGFKKGLLEWRLSLEFGFRYLEGLAADRCLEMRYEDLVLTPREICKKLQEFLEVEWDESMEQFAVSNVSQRDYKVASLTNEDVQIAGNWFDYLGYA